MHQKQSLTSTKPTQKQYTNAKNQLKHHVTQQRLNTSLRPITLSLPSHTTQQTDAQMTFTLSLRTRFAIMSVGTIAYYLALFIVTEWFATKTTPPSRKQKALLWGLFMAGWVVTVILLDWATHWLLARSILRLNPPPLHHDNISLESFGNSLQQGQFPPPIEPHPLHIRPSPSTEPLRPRTHQPAYDPTAPLPTYDPTAPMRLELERSWINRQSSRRVDAS